MNFMPSIDAARSRLAALTEEDAARPVREGGWSRKQILGHLIDSASNNHQRFVRAILNGGLDWPSYEQERWVEAGGYHELPWTELVALWSSYNRLLSHVVSRMPEHAAGFRCRIGHEGAMSLGELVRAYLTHMEHHLRQILD